MSYLVTGIVEFALIVLASKIIMTFCVRLGVENDIAYQMMNAISSIGSVLLFRVFTVFGILSILRKLKKESIRGEDK